MARNPSHRTYERRWKATTAALSKADLDARIFSCVMSGGLVSYSDKYVEVDGDYKRLASLDLGTLELAFRGTVRPDMRAWIKADAAKIQAKRGQQFQVSGAGQTVTLGFASATMRAEGGAR